METHTLQFVQHFPLGIECVWDFFSRPLNLARLTPPEMRFRLTGGSGAGPIHEGMRITYTLYPFMLVPVFWETEISRVEKPFVFEDVQLSGPYLHWVHRHQFKAVNAGTEMTDTIFYRMPGGVLGELADSFILSHRLREVFEYRRQKGFTLLGRGKMCNLPAGGPSPSPS
jgi:ligand-binding SRPBCC domain-containing protein